MTVPEHTGKATILVVDDTPENLTLMSALLKDFYQVRVANHGDRALKIAMSDKPPDLILLDIMMPDIDGYEVCRRLKADGSTRDIPIIFLTARSDTEDEQKGLELGAVDYITKPISPPIVLARVAAQLSLKASADFLREKNEFLREKNEYLKEKTLFCTTKITSWRVKSPAAPRRSRRFRMSPFWSWPHWQKPAMPKPATIFGVPSITSRPWQKGSGLTPGLKTS